MLSSWLYCVGEFRWSVVHGVPRQRLRSISPSPFLFYVCDVVRRFLDCSILQTSITGLLEGPKKVEARICRVSAGDAAVTRYFQSHGFVFVHVASSGSLKEQGGQ